MADKKNSFDEKKLIITLEDFFKKAPHLPSNIREVLVKIVPWFALVFGILGIIAGLGVVGIAPIGLVDSVGTSAFLMISGVLTIVAYVLMLMAFPKLQKHQYAGWRLLFWSQVVSILASVVGMTPGSILGIIIGALIGLYLLFEIKSYYK